MGEKETGSSELATNPSSSRGVGSPMGGVSDYRSAGAEADDDDTSEEKLKSGVKVEVDAPGGISAVQSETRQTPKRDFGD